MQVSYIMLNGSVVVNFNGETHNVAKGDIRFDNIVQAIKDNALDTIPKLVQVGQIFDEMGDSGVEFRNNSVYIDGERIPDAISDRIIDFYEKELPFESLVKFARKLALNPSYNSRKMLYKFLEHNGHPITPDGNFIAYRGVTKDFKDKHTRTFDNSVGATCEVPRDSVDDNPNNTCSSGLHVACYEYAKGFAETLIEVEVDPIDVVAVPTDYNGTKMRVCKFKVLNVSKGSMRTEALYTDHIKQECELVDNCGCEGEDELDESDFAYETDTVEVNLHDSSIIECATYNPTHKELIVYFHNGAVYCYEDVGQKEVTNWEWASSVGSHFTSYIAHSYKYTQIM